MAFAIVPLHPESTVPGPQATLAVRAGKSVLVLVIDVHLIKHPSDCGGQLCTGVVFGHCLPREAGHICRASAVGV